MSRPRIIVITKVCIWYTMCVLQENTILWLFMLNTRSQDNSIVVSTIKNIPLLYEKDEDIYSYLLVKPPLKLDIHALKEVLKYVVCHTWVLGVIVCMSILRDIHDSKHDSLIKNPSWKKWLAQYASRQDSDNACRRCSHYQNQIRSNFGGERLKKVDKGVCIRHITYNMYCSNDLCFRHGINGQEFVQVIANY